MAIRIITTGYNGLSQEVIDFCDDRGIDYHIKDGTFTEKERQQA
jgi:hypothetical protein